MKEFDFSNADIHSDEIHHHSSKDPHQQASALSDIILGGQDGLVNVLGIILGLAAATGDTYVIMVGGLAATFAESVSMAAVAYTSTLADADYYESEREREYRHIQEVPNLEKEEIRAIYRAKGFAGDLLERIVPSLPAEFGGVSLREGHVAGHVGGRRDPGGAMYGRPGGGQEALRVKLHPEQRVFLVADAHDFTVIGL